MKNEEMMKSGSVWKAIASMAIPSAVIMILMIFYNIADMFFIARLGDNAQVAAVSVVSPVFSIMSAIAMMLGNGGCTMIAKAFGAGEKDKAKTYSSLCMWTAIVLAVVFIVLALTFVDPLLAFLGAKGDVALYAKKYMIPIVLGSPFMMISTSVALLLRAEGAVMEGFCGNLIGTVVNLILDPIFILVFHWGVAGAALASVAGNALATFYYSYVISKKSQAMSFSLKYARKDVGAIGHILILGLPNAIASILSGFASTFSNQILSGYGTDALAAMAAAGKCTMIATTLVMAVGMGCQALISYNYGAQNIPRLKEVVQQIIYSGLCYQYCGRCLLLSLPKSHYGTVLNDGCLRPRRSYGDHPAFDQSYHRRSLSGVRLFSGDRPTDGILDRIHLTARTPFDPGTLYLQPSGRSGWRCLGICGRRCHQYDRCPDRLSNAKKPLYYKVKIKLLALILNEC